MSQLENLPTVYEPQKVEPQVRQMWEQGGYFHAVPNDPRPAYTIVIPPPNVTGALHGGHALNNTLQDILIRWRRMSGFNTLWMPGTDHAGIATQAVVEKRIFETEKISRHDLGRDELVRRIWDWKEQYGNRIIEQLKLMGCSCDWERTRFTLDEVCARAVRHTFFRLFRDGLIVRGKRLVNWDTHLQTAVADDEVYHETVKGHFYHFKYPVKPKEGESGRAGEGDRERRGDAETRGRGETEPEGQATSEPDAQAREGEAGEPAFVEIATTRPETMLGDTAVAVHPDPAGALDKAEADLKQQLADAPEKERPAIQAQIDAVADRRRTMLPLLLKLRDMARDGRKLILPLVDREIPLICDEWADPMLGTGAVKITPAHDANDYEVGRRHPEIGTINVMTPDGKIARIVEPNGSVNPNSSKYEGLRFATVGREKVVDDLRELGLLGNVEERQIDLGHSDRSKTPVEPYLSDQWFVRMGDLPPEEASRIEGLRGSKGLAQLAMDAVCQEQHANEEERIKCGKVHFFPARYAKTYLDWLGEKRDWCISRQLWWGHQIPVWSKQIAWEQFDLRQLDVIGFAELESKAATQIIRAADGKTATIGTYDAITEDLFQKGDTCVMHVCLLEDDPAMVALLEKVGFKRDPDVLDTWFSSALWPHSTLGWPADDGGRASRPPGGQDARPPGLPEADKLLARYYPGSVLSTAREIITLWVARMVLTGRYNLGKVPFHDVYIHAVIQDAQGRPFKKTLGNGFDPVDIIDFYGADALRYTMATCSTDMQDIRMPMKKVKTADGRELQSSERFEVGRNFCNKIWNAARFAFMTLSNPPEPPLSKGGTSSTPPLDKGGLGGVSLDTLPIEDRWILSRISRAAVDVQDALGKFQFSRAAGTARDFFWDSLCDWYLELVKLRIRENKQAAEARAVLAFALDQSIRLLHPFVPHITEGLWQTLNEVAPHRDLPSLGLDPQCRDAETAKVRAAAGLSTVSGVTCEPASGESGQTPPVPPLERGGGMLIVCSYPPAEGWPTVANTEVESVFADLQTATRAVREIRQTQSVAPKQTVDVTIRVPAKRVASMQREAHVIEELANVGKLTIDPGATSPRNAATLVVGDMQIFVHDVIDPAAERQRLEKELANLDRQIAGLAGKLSKDGFVNRAPAEVVAAERQRLADLQAKRRTVEQTLAALG